MLVILPPSDDEMYVLKPTGSLPALPFRNLTCMRRAQLVRRSQMSDSWILCGSKASWILCGSKAS